MESNTIAVLDFFLGGVRTFTTIIVFKELAARFCTLANSKSFLTSFPTQATHEPAFISSLWCSAPLRPGIEYSIGWITSRLGFCRGWGGSACPVFSNRSHPVGLRQRGPSSAPLHHWRGRVGGAPRR